MTQSQGVTHLVHDHFFQGLGEVLFGQFGSFFGQSLSGKNRSSKSGLLLHSDGQATIGMAAGAGKLRGFQCCLGWLIPQQRTDTRRREVLVRRFP